MAAIRFVAAAKAKKAGTLNFLQIACQVKPGASHKQEGITAVREDRITVKVAAQATEGQANKATVELISKVLQVPKSDVQIVKGHFARDKVMTIAVREQQHQNSTPEELVEATMKSLTEAINTQEK